MKYFTYYHFILAMCDGFIRYFSITCLDISANTKNEDASTKPLVKWKCNIGSCHLFLIPRQISVLCHSVVCRVDCHLCSAHLWPTRPALLRICPRRWCKIDGKTYAEMCNGSLHFVSPAYLHSFHLNLRNVPAYWAAFVGHTDQIKAINHGTISVRRGGNIQKAIL